MLGSKILSIRILWSYLPADSILIYDFLNAYFELKLSVTICFALPSTNRENKR